MKKSRFSEAQIIGILRQQGQGQTVVRICREHSISEPTFYQWKSKYGGLELTELQRLKQLVADLSLENQVVKEVLRKK